MRRECFQVTLCTSGAKEIASRLFFLHRQTKLTNGCFSHSPKQEATGQVGSRPWHGPCEACVEV